MSSMANMANMQPPSAEVEEEGFSLLAFFIVLARHKLLVLGFPIVVAIATTVWVLRLPNLYTATTSLIPPQAQQSSASAFLSQLSGGAGQIAAAAGLRTPADMYASMIKSRTVADNVVRRLNLAELQQITFSQARKKLMTRTEATAGKDGLIVVSVDDVDPKQAALLANTLVEEFSRLTGTLAVTEASQRRLFFEKQLAQARENLVKAEIAARQSLNQKGFANIDAQGRALAESSARLRGQISAQEVKISTLRSFAADQNPELIKAQNELAALKSELARLEGSSDGANAQNNSPSGLESLRLVRELKYFETVTEALTKQYEIAKLDEAKEGTVIQVVDKAIEPEQKSKPKRAFIILAVTVAATIFAIICAFLLEMLAKSRLDPQSQARWTQLRQTLGWRKQ